MKLGKRIFLIMGALSIFSLIQFDAMAANDCTKDVKPGEYCWHRGSTPKCPEGCWCKGNTKNRLDYDAIGGQEDVALFCKNKKVADLQTLKRMHYAGVYICGIDYGNIPGWSGAADLGYNTAGNGGLTIRSYSEKGSDSIDDCRANFCAKDVAAGKFCHDHAYDSCPKGCWCDGGNKRSVDIVGTRLDACQKHTTAPDPITNFDVKKYLESRGVHYCPDDKPYSNLGAKSESDCNAGVAEAGKPCGDNNPAAPGFFCKAGLTYKCRKGCYCLGGKNTNTGWAIDDLCRTHDETKINGINDKNDTGIRVCTLSC